MNKKGQVNNLVLKIMLSVIVLIMIMIMAQPTKQAIDLNTNTTELNCSSSTLSTGNQATCVITSFLLFYIIGAAISMSMAFIAGRKNMNGAVSAIVIFVIVAVLIEPLKDFIIYLRDASHLNCASTTIGVAGRLSCIVVDLWLFWFVMTVLAASLTYMFVKVRKQ